MVETGELYIALLIPVLKSEKDNVVFISGRPPVSLRNEPRQQFVVGVVKMHPFAPGPRCQTFLP